MKTLQWTNIDKTSWPRGEWDSESDKVQWKDEETGLSCLAKRSPHGGNWCGYVGVTEGHPAFGKEYDDVRVLGGEGEAWPDVHGGLTFADFCDEVDDHGKGICHLPEPGEPDRVYWLGFDCAHGYDYSPGYYGRNPKLKPLGSEVYRTLDYVKQECASLAAQLMRKA